MRFRSFLAAVVLVATTTFANATGAVAETIDLWSTSNLELGSDVVEKDVQHELSLIAQSLRTADLEAVVVVAYAYTPDATEKDGLALRRAQNVRAFLILEGLDPDKLFVEGRVTQPLARSSMISLDVFGR